MKMWASNSNEAPNYWGWAGPGNNVTQKEIDANEQLLLDLIADTERAKITRVSTKSQHRINADIKKSDEVDSIRANILDLLRTNTSTLKDDEKFINDIQSTMDRAIIALERRLETKTQGAPNPFIKDGLDVIKSAIEKFEILAKKIEEQQNQK